MERDYDLDPRAARNLLDYLREQQAATRVLPSERTIVVERFRDEIGDWRICILSPYGGRVHSAWALALIGADPRALRAGGRRDLLRRRDRPAPPRPRRRRRRVLPSAAELVLIEPDEVAQAVTAELGSSALFGARFRENAGRALLIPRAYPGRRTPLWQQRLKSQNLLEVAKRYADFPILLETYRECLRDVLDLPGLEALLRGLHTREISLVEVETPTASPFASSLLFDYVATYMYEGDTPTAERRAAALSLDRDLLRELLGQEELRELIDPAALARVEDDLQCRSEIARATGRDGLHDVLRRVGDLTLAEVRERVLEGIGRSSCSIELERERRAIRLRVGGEERYVAADEAGLYRDALGAVPPGGLPEAFLADVPDALRVLVARFARTHGPFTGDELHARYGVDAARGPARARALGDLVRGELRPGGSEREWCDVEVLRRLRRASLAALRKEIEPADARALAAFLPSWQGVDRHSGAGAGVDRLREVLVPLQGLALPAEIWERDVLPRRIGAYSPAWLDSLCASGEVVWVGAGSLGRSSGRVALYFREDAPLIGPPPAPRSSGAARAPRRASAGPSSCASASREGRPSSPTCSPSSPLAGETLREALWDLVWAGEATNDAWAPLRAPHLSLARGGVARAGATAWRPGGACGRRCRAPRSAGAAEAQAQVQGRWSLTGRCSAGPLRCPRPSVAACSRSCSWSATGSSPASRSSPRGSAAASRCSTTRSPSWRRSASVAAATSSRAWVARSSRSRARSSACAPATTGAAAQAAGERPHARDRRRRPGAALRSRAPLAQTRGAGPPSRPRRRSLCGDGRRRSRCCTSSVEDAVSRRSGLPGLPCSAGASAVRRHALPALAALAEAVCAGRVGKLALERIDGEPAISSGLVETRRAGFPHRPAQAHAHRLSRRAEPR